MQEMRHYDDAAANQWLACMPDTGTQAMRGDKPAEAVCSAKEHKQVVVAARVVRSSGKRHSLLPIPNSHDCCSHPTSSFPPQARLTESSQGQSQPMESSQHAILIR